MLDHSVLARVGVRLLIHPITLLLEKIRAQRDALAAIKSGASATDETVATARELLRVDRALAFSRRGRPVDVDSALDEESRSWHASAT
jgi:hypothetical protein